MTILNIADYKKKTGVGFGTSGIRDLVEKMTDKTAYVYTTAFLKHCKMLGELDKGQKVAIAGDLRSSTPRIMMAVAKAVSDFGCEVVNCGLVPTPAVSYFGMKNGWQSIMVTGSHIPDDRNGIKFNLAKREVLKSDETAISNMQIEIENYIFDEDENLVAGFKMPENHKLAYIHYKQRYLNFFDRNFLRGKVVGVWGHSSVGRDMYVELFRDFGAKVIKIDYSISKFVPVDTDEVNEITVEKMKKWSSEHKLDFVISTDGDGDRPLLADEKGNQIRSELLPLFAARYLGIEAIASTLTACTVLEKTKYFKKVIRTKVGSPHIVEAMLNLQNNFTKVAGYELNGGFLLGSSLELKSKKLLALPTRDALTAILGTLALSKETCTPLSKMISDLPSRFTYSSSIKGIPTERSLAVLDNWEKHKVEIEDAFGEIVEVNVEDGLRFTFDSGDIVHFRPSKNAPEFREYVDSDSYKKATALSLVALDLIKRWTL